MKWQVRRIHPGEWGIRRSDDDWWHDSLPTHAEAVDYADKLAVIDQVFDGTLTRWREAKRWLNAGWK